MKYDTSLHITPGSLDNFPDNDSSRSNFYERSNCFKEFGGCKVVIVKKYYAAGMFWVYAFNYGYGVTFSKTLKQSQY